MSINTTTAAGVHEQVPGLLEAISLLLEEVLCSIQEFHGESLLVSEVLDDVLLGH